MPTLKTHTLKTHTCTRTSTTTAAGRVCAHDDAVTTTKNVGVPGHRLDAMGISAMRCDAELVEKEIFLGGDDVVRTRWTKRWTRQGGERWTKRWKRRRLWRRVLTA